MTLSTRAVEAAEREFRLHFGNHIEFTADEIRTGIKEMITSALAVDGLRLVPKEPTEDMLDFGSCYEDPLSLYKKYPIFDEGDISREVYRAMIAAASDGEERPSPSAGTGE